SSRRRHTRLQGDWSSDVCSSDLQMAAAGFRRPQADLGYGEPDDWITAGQAFELGTRTLTAIATPGHTRGHLVFADHEAGLLFAGDRKSTRLNSSHLVISYAVFCL